MVSSSGNDDVRIETCSSIQRDIVIQNIWEQYSAFCWSEYCELIIDSARCEQYKMNHYCWKNDTDRGKPKYSEKNMPPFQLGPPQIPTGGT
jgi:hypothetical protein